MNKILSLTAAALIASASISHSQNIYTKSFTHKTLGNLVELTKMFGDDFKGKKEGFTLFLQDNNLVKFPRLEHINRKTDLIFVQYDATGKELGNGTTPKLLVGRLTVGAGMNFRNIEKRRLPTVKHLPNFQAQSFVVNPKSGTISHALEAVMARDGSNLKTAFTYGVRGTTNWIRLLTHSITRMIQGKV